MRPWRLLVTIAAALVVPCADVAHADSALIAVGAGVSSSGGVHAAASVDLHTQHVAASVRGWVAAPRVDAVVGLASAGAVVPLVGARQDAEVTSLVGAMRWYLRRPTRDDLVEIGLTAPIAGHDRVFVQHARYAPGWYARVQLRRWRLVVAAEAGVSGLATRAGDGTMQPAAYATITAGIGISR